MPAPPLSGYPVSTSGRAAAPAPPARSYSSGWCLGCLGWLQFVEDVLVLGGSVAALYLWVTAAAHVPRLTRPTLANYRTSVYVMRVAGKR